jgi:hypothetical protein
MELILLLVVFGAGAACGFAGYRWALKKDPARLEALAKKIKEAGE